MRDLFFFRQPEVPHFFDTLSEEEKRAVTEFIEKGLVWPGAGKESRQTDPATQTS